MTATPTTDRNAESAGAVPTGSARLIDTWFPCPEVDIAVGTPAGSGLSEKALFTWFASRPIAQARAAVLCSLLPDTPDNRKDIRSAVQHSDPDALSRLRRRITDTYGGKSPVVLDMFSGRGIIPLEAARAGTTAIGIDLSPVATLAGRLLADYPLRDWSGEPELPYAQGGDTGADDEGGDDGSEKPVTKARGRGKKANPDVLALDGLDATPSEPRLVRDVRTVLAEVGRRVAAQVSDLYPGNPARGGAVPWAYLWAVTMPCDDCGRRFPLLGSMVLRHPYTRTRDVGQSMRIATDGDVWRVQIHSGASTQTPTLASASGKRGKSARCPFPDCGYTHTLDVIKAKGFAGQYDDTMLAVAEVDPGSQQKTFRTPRPDEVAAASKAGPHMLPRLAGMSAVPDERIPPGVNNSIRGSGYGYPTYGSLMNDRQAVLFATTARTITELHQEMAQIVSDDYATALAGYVTANLVRALKYSTRGSGLQKKGKPDGSTQNRVMVDHVFSSQSVVKHQFDFIETGPLDGPGTWTSVSTSSVNALKKVLADTSLSGRPGRFRRESAVSLPYRDGTVDAIVTDSPYLNMITYADSSDIFYVWIKRALGSVMPDLFDGNLDGSDGLQDKSDEIIVTTNSTPGDHRTESFYEAMLARAFGEARRILKLEGHLTLVFGHSDPAAWKRILAALTTAGFVVTSSWPSRTEKAVTGVATINVTVSIGCRVAPEGRPVGIASQVDAEVLADVKRRCREWDADGLALQDQLMSSYGAALQIVGKYSKVITPTGAEVGLEHYMGLSRKAVRDAVALRLDELPLETFDPHTRLAVFWHELNGRSIVAKGEARFFAQSDDLRLEDLRGPILVEDKAGYRLRHDPPATVTPASSVYEVVRAMAGAWSSGSDAVAAVIGDADRSATDPHLWAVVDWVAAKLLSSDPVAVSLAAVKRNKSTIQGVAGTATMTINFDGETP